MLQLSVNLLFGLIGFSLYCYWQQFGGNYFALYERGGGYIALANGLFVFVGALAAARGGSFAACIPNGSTHRIQYLPIF
jgi:hypothetical protein